MITNDREVDVVITIAFRCMYNMLVFWNKYMYDFNDKRFKVRYVFEREKIHRLLVNQELKILTRGSHRNG